MTGQEKFDQRLKWFTDRIGKRIFRDANACSCEFCKSVETIGLIVKDEMHADYLTSIEMEAGITYFDTKEECKNSKK